MSFVTARLPIAIIAISAIICVALVIFVIVVSSRRPLTPLEATLLQIVILGTGVTASYLISQKATKVAAKPQARSAFRRVKSLYSGLFYLKGLIDRHRARNAKAAGQVIEVIEAVVDQQINTVADALEDWRDMVPEEVAKLEQQLREQERVQSEDLKR